MPSDRKHVLKQGMRILGVWVNWKWDRQIILEWGLDINFDKSKIMIFNKTGRLFSHNFSIDNVILESVRQYKYLGVLFSLNGNFTNALNDLYHRGQKAFFKICSTFSSSPASVAQLDAPSDWRPGGRGFNPRRGQQHSFVEIDHEIFSTVILSLPLIQEGQLSVSGERMCTVLVNHLED